MKRKKTNVAAAVLSCSLGLSTISPVLAEENVLDSTQSLASETQIVEQNKETETNTSKQTSDVEETETTDTSEQEVKTDDSTVVENPTEEENNPNEATNTMDEEIENSNEEVSTGSVRAGIPFTGLTGDFEETDTGMRINQQDGDNILISSVQGKIFSFAGDVTFESGVNKTSLIFGAEKNTSPTDIGKFFGLELSLSGNDVQIKLFQNPLSDPTALGDEIISPTTVTSVNDTTQPIHWTVSVDGDNNLVITVNGITAQYEMKKDFKGAYQGGYFGFLTFQSQVHIENMTLSAQPIPQSNFQTNLENLHGLNGTWRETEEGLYSSGTGDNFAISDTKVKNFEYSANIRNEGKKGAGSLLFRADENPSGGTIAMNVDYSANVFKLFSFGSGAGTYETVSLASVPENEDGSYDLKVQMYENHLRVYVNGTGIINRDIDVRPDEGRLGLLTWDGTVIYQNVQYKELDSWEDIEEPHLTGIKLPEGVTITPEFDESVSVYGMDIQPDVDEAVIGLEAKEGTKLYVTKSDENGNIIKEKEEITDGTFTISKDEFFEDYMNVDVTIESDSFTSIVNFAVNKWTSTEDLANEEYRAQFHITPQSNFMNDPNGMVYDSTDGYWHVYYQYSTKNNFNNQSWAHVRSKDLVTWEQMPLAIQIDDNGLIFSGCGVEDLNNDSGLFSQNKKGDSYLIVYYTYNGANGQSQAYAYSTDHGVTWKKGSIILDNNHSLSGADFRDPKVFQVPGDNEHYYMITAGGDAQIFTSTNLIDWEFSQELKYLDGTRINSECPMMYQATIEGTDETKWIYGGSAGFYVVGDMVKDEETGIYKWYAESERLNVESNENPWAGFGKYATMTFWDDPTDKDRVIGISWLQDTKDFSGKDYKGVQSLPQEYGLKLIDGKYVITCYPVEEVDALRDTENMLYEGTKGITVTPEDGNILQGASGITYDLEATFDLDDTTATEFGFKLRKGNGQEMVYKYDVEQQKMVLDVSQSDSCQNSGVWQQTLIPMEGNKIQLRIIVDQGAVESFGNYGEANISTVAYMSKDNIGMEFFTDGSITIDSLNIYDMKSMYTGESGSVTEDQQLYLDAPSYVETGSEFTVNANVYPNKGNSGVTWSYGEGLEVVSEGTTSTTLKASQPGTYTISATAGDLTKEVSVRVADPNFENNADGWQAISGSWKITDEGLIGNNVGTGDSFYLSDARVSADKVFTITGNLKIEQGQAAGIVFGVTDKNNPAANWFCANIDTVDGIAKLFQNNGNEMWNVTKPLSEITPKTDGSYDLKIMYDGAGTMTYYVNDVLVGSNSGTNFSEGYVGVQTFKSTAVFNNLQINAEGGTITGIIGTVDPITVQTGTSLDTVLAQLPNDIQVRMDNNTFSTASVSWDTSGIDLSSAGTYTIVGTVAGFSDTINVQLTVQDEPVSIDTSKLESLIQTIQNTDLSGYTTDSVNALKTKLNEATALLEKENVTQTEIDSMLQELQAAFDGLVKKDTTDPGDTGDGGQTTGGDKGNNSSDKDSSRTNGTNTGVAVGMGLFGGLAGISALGAGVLSFLKRRKK